MDAGGAIVLGFVGGRVLTDPQRKTLAVILRSGPARELHHPARSAADAAFVRMVRSRFRSCTVVSHPQEDPCRTSPDCVRLSTAHCPPKFWIFALRAVVDAADVTIAAPDAAGLTHWRRDPAGVALRYAQKIGKNLIVVRPDGAADYHQERAANGQDVNRVD